MAKCDYCGQEQAAEEGHCSGCGKSFVAEHESPLSKKSKAIAVILAAIFGPLGLLYLGTEGAIALLLAVGITIFVLPVLLPAIHMTGLGLLISLLARVACVWWALAVIDRDKIGNDNESNAQALLDEAVKLESIDFGHAVAKYEEVIRNYPESRASTAAKNCIDTLRANMK
jgi:membrane protein implicated in regulation of membrane protease activity